jgi:hypothetical protein
MPDFTATFTIHLTASITARDEDSASKKAERLFAPVVRKIGEQLPPGVEWEADDYNPEITES